MKKIGFIGAGNMGGALAVCVSKVGDYDIILSDKDEGKALALAKKIGAEVKSTSELAEICDCIFLGVKPAFIGSVIEEIKNTVGKDTVIVSMAAGVALSKLEGHFGYDLPIIRIMPNTPCAIGEGVILVAPNKFAEGKPVTEFKNMMSGAGLVDLLDEKYIDAASAVSGCGPAFVYMFAEALADGAVASGLPRDKALLYACKTVRGAAQMILDSGKHPEQLKDEVCSPGGTTIEGVRALDAGAMRGTVSGAVVAAYEKTLKLAK